MADRRWPEVIRGRSQAPLQRRCSPAARGRRPRASPTILRKETVGGALLLVAAAVALIWANSPWSAVLPRAARLHVGPDRFGLHLDLSLGAWAADGLLAIFFFVVGLELKREFVAGDLRDPRRAALPIAAAVGGMVVPAAIFVAFTCSAGDGAAARVGDPDRHRHRLRGGRARGASPPTCPSALRTFLLTLAVVDDLLAITVIAVFYTDKINLAPLLAGADPAGALRRRWCSGGSQSWWLLIPLALLTWALVHESGVHATVAGVLLGFTVPVLRSERGRRPGGRARAGRALRAPDAAALRRFRGAGVRLLRRRCDRRRL